MRDYQHLSAANEQRTMTAGQRDAVALQQALDVTGGRCPEHFRQVALARIGAPDKPWSVIAAELGITKDTAAGYARRLLKMAARPSRGGDR